MSRTMMIQVIIIINNEPITMPTIPPMGNGEEILISLTVVDESVIVVNATVVFVVVDVGSVEEIVRIVGI